MLLLQENTYSLNEKYSHAKNTQRQTSWNPEISQAISSVQNQRHGSKYGDNGRWKLEVASALLSVGTGNELTLDMPALETEQNKITNSNLEDLTENSLRGDDTNVTIAVSDSSLIKIDDVEIDPNLHELKEGNFSWFFLVL